MHLVLPSKPRLVGCLLAALAPAALGQSVTGLFLGTEAGQSGREIYTIEIPGSDRVVIADLRGNRFAGRLDGDGNVLLDAGGTLTVASPRLLTLSPAGGETVSLERVFATDTEFPLAASPGPFIPNPLLTGAWDIVELSLDPVSGEVLPQFDGSREFIDVFDLTSEGSGLRFTDSLGTYFQFTMRTGDEAVGRIINNVSARNAGQPLSLPGSDNNFQRDVLGWARFPDPNHFEAFLMLQTLALSNPTHFLLTIDGTRQDLLPAGDLNGDRIVDAADREAFVRQFGLSPVNSDYNLTADLDGNRYVDRRDRDLFDQGAPDRKRLGPWMSGLWFNPERDGEGFHLVVTDDASAVVAWFTYNPDGGQAWVIGTANVIDSQLVFESLLITSGARFGSGFLSDEVVRETWGNLRIFFDDCDNGWVSYAGPNDFANGGYGLARLTVPVGLDCAAESVRVDDKAGRYSGIWFDPSQDGAGWFVDEIAGDQAAVTWFTYDLEGNQQWMIGVGPIADDGINVETMQLTSGARFGDQFDADDVVRTDWGQFGLSSDCGTGTVTYDSGITGYGTGEQTVDLLARIDGLACDGN
ncbi:MAG: hypothetical protein AAGA95_06185 [Pseudomonadota bacterium]